MSGSRISPRIRLMALIMAAVFILGMVTSVGLLLLRGWLSPVAVNAEATTTVHSVTVTDAEVVSLIPIQGVSLHFIPGNKLRATYSFIGMEISVGVTGGRLWFSGIPTMIVSAFQDRIGSYMSGQNPEWECSFTVDTSASAGSDVITLTNGLVTRSTTPTFDWSAFTKASETKYAIEISRTGDFSQIILRKSGWSTEGFTHYTLGQNEALTNGAYYWRVIEDGTLWVTDMPPWLDASQYDPQVTTLPTMLSVTTSEGAMEVTYMITSSGPAGGPQPPGVTSVLDVIDEQGTITQSLSALSDDSKCTLILDKGVKALSSYGTPLKQISIIKRDDPPQPPAKSSIIGLAYDFGPGGATFDPAITVKFKYDPGLIPQGVAEKNLVIAVWDSSTGTWVVLDGIVVDTANHTITANVSHFTAFAILAYTSPAGFAVSGLTVSPREVGIAEAVTISAVVANTGDLAGSYKVTLKVDGVVIAAKDVTLAGGASEKVTFTTAKDLAGTYSVDVSGLTGTFVVRLVPAAFKVSTLTITPAEVGVGEGVTVSVVVANTGSAAGSYKVTLKVDGVAVATKDVTLAGGASEQATFTTAKDLVGTYSVDVNGLTGTFVVKAAPVFGVRALTITPAEVGVGEGVTVSVVVANTGSAAGSYKVTLKVDGAEIATKDVTLAGGASEQVAFTTAKDLAGTYNVDVNGLTGAFVVQEASISLINFNWWWLVWGFVAVCVVIGVILALAARR